MIVGEREGDRETETERQMDGRTDRQTDRQAGRQAGRQTDRDKDRDTENERQTNRGRDRQRKRDSGRWEGDSAIAEHTNCSTTTTKEYRTPLFRSPVSPGSLGVSVSLYDLTNTACFVDMLTNR